MSYESNSPTINSNRLGLWLPMIVALALVTGCGYHYYMGPLEPVSQQATSMTIADDGSVTYVQFYEGQKKRQRFAVFSLNVKNYEYPKVRIDPARVQILASNGRVYWSLSKQQLNSYYRAYAIGYRGNAYSQYRERRDLLARTMLGLEEVFSGQEVEGLVVFPNLHPDVGQVSLVVHDLVLRFDYRDEPVEMVELTYDFQRDIGRLYPDGTVQLSANN